MYQNNVNREKPFLTQMCSSQMNYDAFLEPLDRVFPLSCGEPHKVSTFEAARVGVALFSRDVPAVQTAHSVLLIPLKRFF